MSQNRGYRRDGRQNYQMNSSQGYGRSQQMAVNPWEGGMVPGGRGGVEGLLPTPPQASSLLSQLSSSPEAQLALASNLLSTILRPQQQSQVPSLLSLDSLGPMGGSGMGYRHGGYGGRYDDPGPNRRKRMDSRRTEPYGKPLQGRRNAPARGGADRKTGGNQGLRSPSVGKGRTTNSKSGGKAEKKDDDTKKEEDKTSDAEKKNDEEDSKREDGEGEEGDEKKRDWKDEKKPEEDKGDKSKETSVSNTRYGGIPPALLYCHVCKKHMWDENSFQNHLKGRTHQLMMDKLEESYKIKVELMRHEQKVAEQQREIELERMKRQGKKVNMNIREYCTMCDLHFFGNLIVHRKNDRHQQLKNFLHPRCIPCGKEFPTRVEWDHHRLTPLHLRKTSEARSKSRKSGAGDDEFGIEELISAKGGEDSRREIKVRTKQEEEDEIKEGDKSRDEGDDEKDESNAEANADGDEKDGEKSDGDTTTVGSLRFRVPKYNPDVAVGLSLLKKMTGQMCRACHRFFINSEDAETHCRTMMHYNNFVALVKEKARAAEAKEKREHKSEEPNKEENAEDNKTEKGGKRSEDMSTVDDEGNWKRRKVANADDDDDEAEADGPEDKDDEKKKTETSEAKGKDKEEPMETNETEAEAEPEPEAEGEVEAEAEEEEEKGKESSKKEDDDDEEEGEEEEEEKDKDKDKKENKSKNKKEDESGDDSIWSEVDRDIGNLLDTVDGEGETESLNEEELLNPKQDETPGKGARGRNKAIRGGSGSAAKATRGRKKK